VSRAARELAALVEALAEQIAQRVVELQAQQPGEEAAQSSPWMSIERAAKYLDLPTQRLYKLTAAGVIPHVKQGGRLLFDREELDTWLRSQAQADERRGD